MKMGGWLILLSVAAVSGCATSLSSSEMSEYRNYEQRGVIVKKKNPATGAALGFLPGGGSFYTRHYGIGVVDLLTWPLSVLWDPINGYNGAKVINYEATKEALAAAPQSPAR